MHNKLTEKNEIMMYTTQNGQMKVDTLDKKKEYNFDEFKRGIFNLRTNFGELAQIMIKKKYGFQNSNDKYYDLYDNDKRIEVKFSRAIEKEPPMNEKNAIELCVKASKLNRIVSSNEATQKKFDCNIQQVKPKEFDILYYGVFFEDCIEIFIAESSQISQIPLFCSVQHKNNVGEGQFHIKRTNITYHREKHKCEIITYEELFELLKKE